MLFHCWIDRTIFKTFGCIFLICKDISLIDWIRLLLLLKNTAKIIREVIPSTTGPFDFLLWRAFAIWILWVSGLACGLNFSVRQLTLLTSKSRFVTKAKQECSANQPSENTTSMHSLARVPPLGGRENHSRIVIKINPIGWTSSSIFDPCRLTLHFTVTLRLTSGRRHQREKIKWH